MNNKQNRGFRFSAKGYCIALGLCAVAIAISGLLYYRSVHSPSAEEQGEIPSLALAATGGDDVQALATAPATSAPAEESSGATEPTVETKTLTTVSPLEGSTVAAYAMDCLAYNPTTRDWRVHDGVDIAAEAGAQVLAAADGTVYTVYTDDAMGATVVLRHDGGYVTTYASLAAETLVAPGDSVAAGQAIGTAANTALLETALGDHLHFAVSCNGVSIDPAAFLGEEE
ncbi:MAG: M23 family metallopeptidase [Firmicutes bacterium]|nr:M23 family metallopeptidase [Bacillota bacterium]